MRQGGSEKRWGGGRRERAERKTKDKQNGGTEC